MNFDAWETVWLCVALSVLVLLLDAWHAHRAGPDKIEQARSSQRGNRMARVSKETEQ
jgi:heme exporter protein D